LLLIPEFARADVGPPAHLRISEREPGLFALEWRVPKTLPPKALPTPHLPERCEPVGRTQVDEQPGAWLFARDWRCEIALAGRSVEMRYPFTDLALTTVVRVELLSGDRFAHVLAPGDRAWRLPEGTAAPDPLEAGRHAVLFGVSHVLQSWAHLVFILAVGILGRLKQCLCVVSALTIGQLAGVVISLGGAELAAAPAEIALALAAAVLVREALLPDEERRRLPVVSAIAGLVHGLAVGSMLTQGIVMQSLAVLGMDAVHLVGSVAVAGLWTLVAQASTLTPLRVGLVYLSGSTGVALAIGLAVSGAVVEPEVTTASPVAVGPSATNPSTGGGGSRRLAPVTPEVPIQSYLSVEPFEVRHEAMLRLAGLTRALDLDSGSTIEVTRQTDLLDRLAALVLNDVTVSADDVALSGSIRRADFMTVDSTGAMPRTIPLSEEVRDAVVGIVAVYPTPGVPETVRLRWDPFPEATSSIPTTVIDPESVLTASITAAEPSVSWDNTLAEDPVPTVEAVEVEPLELPVPLVSLPLLIAAAGVMIAGIRRRQVGIASASARVILAVAFVAAPLAQTTLAFPGAAGRPPSEGQARRILAGLLPNVYRAMEFRDEAMIYDRLEVSVTGEALVDVYLEQRRALEMEDRGGAHARVEAVEILEASEIERQRRGFGVRSTWTVGGMVTHFGHRHFRENRYDARLTIVPTAGTWKIQSIEILEQDRLE